MITVTITDPGGLSATVTESDPGHGGIAGVAAVTKLLLMGCSAT